VTTTTAKLIQFKLQLVGNGWSIILWLSK